MLFLALPTLPNDENTAERIGDAAASGEECDAHDTIRYAEGEANDGHHPHHEIGQEA